jgi:TonB family protein
MSSNVHNSFAFSAALHIAALAVIFWAVSHEAVFEPVHLSSSFTLIPASEGTSAVQEGLLPKVSIPKFPKPRIALPGTLPLDSITATTSHVRQISFDDYRRAHPGSQGSSKSPLLSPPRVKVDSPSFVSPQSLTEEPAIGDDVMSEIVAALKEGFRGDDASLVGLSTLVEFVVYNDGRLGSGRVIQSSGSQDFDAEVLAAMGRARARKGLVESPRRFRVVFRVAK